ncbi:MAG: hypothetical protein K0S67_826 [Nitrososphaeraceae archaeon]|nr:hypothetical protein [Nitrososphaeraceae archaeon]MDF2769047.1 hypothetical protein [Nitrososphaeraceae archaeon]
MRSINSSHEYKKKNHDAVMRLNKQFADIIREYGAWHSFFQLNNIEVPMEGLTNIAKAVSANRDEEVWLELIFYRDRKHRDDVCAKMQNDESCGSLFRHFMDLVTPGTSCIIGEFTPTSRYRVTFNAILFSN